MNITLKETHYYEGLDISEAFEEFASKGTLSFGTIEKLLGPAPKIPDSPDTDAMLDAWEDLAAYSETVIAIENYLKSLMATA